MRRSLAFAGSLAVTIALAAAPASRADDTPLQTKAGDLFKFALFIDWPASSFSASGAPFDICVIGDDPFGPALDRTMDGQHVGDRTIQVHRLATSDGAGFCEIAFLAGSAKEPIKDAIHRLAGAPVLTVTDASASPGMIDFTDDDARVRFRIDDQAAAASGLTISSKLLSLAATVIPRAQKSPAP